MLETAQSSQPSRHDDSAQSLHIASAVGYGLLSDPAFPVPEDVSHVLSPLAVQERQDQTDVCSADQCQAADQSQAVDIWWDKVLQFQADRSNARALLARSQPPGLQSRLKTGKNNKVKRAAQPLFDLGAINERVAAIVQHEQENCLELPKYTGKVQKREVRLTLGHTTIV